MPGPSSPRRSPSFYHPLTALTYVFDLRLFGLTAAPYYATNLLLHLVAVAPCTAWRAGSGWPFWAAAVTALVFGLHPIAEATVPVIPRRQDLVVGACFISSMSLLVRADLAARGPGAASSPARSCSSRSPWAARRSPTPACRWCRSPCSVRRVPFRSATRLLRRTIGVFACFLAVEAVGFAVRWRVLGGLGGYYGSEANRGNLSGVVEFFLRPYVDALLWPIHGLLPERLRDWLSAILLAWSSPCCRCSAARPLLSIVVLAWSGRRVFCRCTSPPITRSTPTCCTCHCRLRARAGRAARRAAGAGLRRATRAGVPTGQGVQTGSATWRCRRRRRRRAASCWPRSGSRRCARATRVPRRRLRLGPLPGSRPALPGVRPGHRPDRRAAEPHRLRHAESQFVDAFVFDNYSLESVLRLLAPGAPVTAQVNSLSDVHERPVRGTRELRGRRAASRPDRELRVLARVPH